MQAQLHVYSSVILLSIDADRDELLTVFVSVIMLLVLPLFDDNG
jgi:hypothetical protein